MNAALEFRIRGAGRSPTLIHLPGLHGDWTLLGPFRRELGDSACLVETSYPRRPEWTLDDYADAVRRGLDEYGIKSGWLLGESFASQIVWRLLEGALEAGASRSRFRIEGVVLVGGFVRHPWPWGVAVATAASRAVPMWALRRLCGLYSAFARRRHCACAEAPAEIEEFVRRRTTPEDRAAVNSRYRLIARHDPRPVARRVRLPVFHLSGGFDPIVPWWQVKPWLRRHCPGYRGSRIVRGAGHNVLMSGAAESVRQILQWVEATRRADAGSMANSAADHPQSWP